MAQFDDFDDKINFLTNDVERETPRLPNLEDRACGILVMLIMQGYAYGNKSKQVDAAFEYARLIIAKRDESKEIQ